VKKSGGGKGGGEARYDVWCMMVDEWGQKRRDRKEGTGRTGKKEAKERNKGTARNRGGDLLATASYLPRAIVHRRKSLEG
jgi:hypothetical protein